MHPPTSSSLKRPAASASSSLHASTTTIPRTTTGSSEDGDGEDSQVLQPTGTIHPWYSPKPFLEAGPWANRSGKYFIDMIKANGGASVFKAHPGLEMTFLTDHASAEWFFSQPESVLDRQVCTLVLLLVVVMRFVAVGGGSGIGTSRPTAGWRVHIFRYTKRTAAARTPCSPECVSHTHIFILEYLT